LITIKAPCQKHDLYFPSILAPLAQEGKLYVFMVECDCDIAYIVANLKEGPHFYYAGSPSAIARQYGEIPWLPTKVESDEGLLYGKQAPSLDELLSYFNESANVRKMKSGIR